MMIYNSAKATFSKQPSESKENFLYWFVGFVEGDGCFGVNKQNNRICFIITQKDPKVLYYIRKNLNFGKVYKNADGYFRYIVSKRKNLDKLIAIFNGRLVLEKTSSRYKEWISSYSQYYRTSQIFDLYHTRPSIIDFRNS